MMLDFAAGTQNRRVQYGETIALTSAASQISKGMIGVPSVSPELSTLPTGRPLLAVPIWTTEELFQRG